MKKKDTANPDTVDEKKVDTVDEKVKGDAPATSPSDAKAGKPAEDLVAKAIAEVQADEDFVHTSAEHLEVRVVRKLLEWGYDITKAEYDVRMRLY